MVSSIISTPLGIFISFLLILSCEAGFRCPNSCSGHGKCDVENLCFCQDGYTGPDCSYRTCPFGESWADKAYALTLAHSTAECSDRGICDRTQGKCRCFPGYQGPSCNRDALSCGQRGNRMEMRYLYDIYTAPHVWVNPNKEVTTYNGWDGTHLTMCMCDWGYTGNSCEMKMCPKGDDPLTTSTGYFTLGIDVFYKQTAGFANAGTLSIQFDGFTTTMFANATDAECKAAFESLRNVGTVTCTRATSGLTVNIGHDAVYIVEFLTFPVEPLQTNHFTHDGRPELASFFCKGLNHTLLPNGEVGSICGVEDLTPTAAVLPEYSYCSNRGVCDFLTGECNCFSAFRGGNCADYQLNSARTSAIGADILSATSTLSTYSRNVMQIAALVENDRDFNMIKIGDSKHNFFTLDRDGEMTMDKGSWRLLGGPVPGGVVVQKYGAVLTGSGGLSVRSGGMHVTEGFTVLSDGLKVGADGLTVTNGATLLNTGLVVRGGMDSKDVRMNISVDGVVVVAGGVQNSYRGITVTNGVTVNSGGLYVHKWATTIRSGGLTVTGGSTIGSEGFYMPDGLTLHSGGLVVSGGATVNNLGLLMSAGGASVKGGGMVLTGGMTSSSDGMKITGGVTVKTDGIIVTSGGIKATSLEVLLGGLVVTGGITTHTGGLVVTTAGLTLHNGGLWLSGGVTVQNIGLITTKGITINSGGLQVTGGVTMHNIGLKVTGGVTVQQGGILVPTKLQVNLEGLKVTGGASVQNDGMTVNGGGTARSAGLVVTASGMTVTAGGGVVTGGLSSQDAGLKVTAGLSVNSGGFLVTIDGLTVNSQGVVVTKTGATVTAGGLVATGGMSLSNVGMSVTGGVTADNIGVVITTGGLTVTAGGMLVTNGVTIQNKGAKVTGGASIQSGGMVVNVPAGGFKVVETVNKGVKVTGGVSVLSGGLRLVLGGETVNAGGVYVTGGLTLIGNGGTVTGGMTVEDVGVRVSAGTVSVVDGGVVVTAGGMSSMNKGLVVTGGFTVDSDGMKVTNGVTVNNDGVTVVGGITTPSLVITAGGLTSSNAGMALTGGASVKAVGVNVAQDGLTLQNSGFKVTAGGMTVSGDGVVVTASGVSILSAGLKTTTGGLTVSAGGLVVTGGLTTMVDGMFVTGGMTTNFHGLVMSAGAANGLTVEEGGINVAESFGSYFPGAMTVKSAGLLVTGGFTVRNKGIALNGGATVTAGGLKLTGGVSVQSLGLVVTGGLTVNGNTNLETAYVVFSDKRLKSNIAPIRGALGLVKRLNGVLYEWDEDAADKYPDYPPPPPKNQGGPDTEPDAKVRYAGLIAQDVMKVIPELVQKASKNSTFFSLGYDGLIPVLVEAIKELHNHVMNCSNVTEFAARSERGSAAAEELKLMCAQFTEEVQAAVTAAVAKSRTVEGTDPAPVLLPVEPSDLAKQQQRQRLWQLQEEVRRLEGRLAVAELESSRIHDEAAAVIATLQAEDNSPAS